MNSGDTLKIILNYTVDGEPLPANFEGEIEFSIGSKRYLLSEAQIGYEDGVGYCIHLSQEDTFDLSGVSSYQIRIKNAEGEVVSSGIEKLSFGKSLSKETI